MTSPSARAWSIAFLGALFVALYVPFLDETRIYLTSGHRDFPSFYYAAQAAFRDGRSPYDPAYLEALAGGTRVFPFIYTPPSLVLLAPLAALPYELSKLAFLALNHLIVLGLLAATVGPLLRLDVERQAAVVAFAVAYMLNFHPLFVQFSHGQVNLVLAALMVLAWLALQRGWASAAGIALGLAVALKTYPVLLLGFLAIQQRWRAIGWTVATVAVLVGLSFVALPRAAWDDWSRDVAPAAGYGAFDTASRALRWPGGVMSPAGVENQSVNGFFARLLTENKVQRPIAVMPGMAKALTYAVNVGLVLASAWVVFAAWRRGARDVDGLMCLTLLLTYLAAPISWEHHLVYLLPVVVALGVWSFSLPAFRGIALTVWLGASMLLAAPFLLRVKIVGVFALWALALYTTWVRASSSSVASEARAA